MIDIANTLSAFLTPVIALLALGIAYFQLTNNRKQRMADVVRLRHELYDRRFEIYLACRRFIVLILQKGAPENSDLTGYWTAISASRFLFDDEMGEYLESFERKAGELQTIRMEAQEEGTSHRSSESADIKRSLNGELKLLNDKFKPYLKIDVGSVE